MKILLDILFVVALVLLFVVWLTTFICMPIIIATFANISLLSAAVGQICLVVFVLIGIVANQVYNV